MRYFIILIIIFLGGNTSAQEDSTYYFFDPTTPIQKIKSKIKSSEDPFLKSYYSLIYYGKVRNTDSMAYFINDIDTKRPFQKNLIARYLYLKAYYNKIIDNDSLAYIYHTNALAKGYKNKDTLTVLYSLSGLSQSWDYNEENYYRFDYLQKLGEAAENYENDSFKIIHNYLTANYYLLRDNNAAAIDHYKKVMDFSFSSQDSILLINTYGNLGALYQENLNKPDSSIYFYNKKLSVIEENKKFSSPENLLGLYNNLSRAYASKKDYVNAKMYLLKAANFNTTKNKVFNDLMISENLAEVNAGLKNFEEAFYNLKTANRLSDSLNKKEHQESIANIIENYDNKTLKTNLRQKEIQQRNLWLGASVLVLILGIISYLIFKNTKRKQRIAEQQREIEIQKTEKILKEQELTTIDAMISGQEKERERLAGDLHDSVGATLAAAKLQFDHLAKNKEKIVEMDELFVKTGDLLAQAYTEVREMAHLKNSGVIAKNGLLPAVQKLAKNASGTNNLTVEVEDFGLDGRLENTLEITIFRIIQELITNIIKHANATEASIAITQHTESLNIIVEDNGKGFDIKKELNKEGMGLSSIERRVEHLEGTMEVDTTLGKGTTILIDIPL